MYAWLRFICYAVVSFPCLTQVQYLNNYKTVSAYFKATVEISNETPNWQQYSLVWHNTTMSTILIALSDPVTKVITFNTKFHYVKMMLQQSLNEDVSVRDPYMLKLPTQLNM